MYDTLRTGFRDDKVPLPLIISQCGGQDNFKNTCIEELLLKWVLLHGFCTYRMPTASWSLACTHTVFCQPLPAAADADDDESCYCCYCRRTMEAVMPNVKEPVIPNSEKVWWMDLTRPATSFL